VVTSASSGTRGNSRQLLENLVVTALRRIQTEIYYYKYMTGREIDFVFLLDGRLRMLILVCESLAEPQTWKRAIVALNAAMAELGLI